MLSGIDEKAGTRGSRVCQICVKSDTLNTSKFRFRRNFCRNFLDTEMIHIRSQYEQNMNMKTDYI